MTDGRMEGMNSNIETLLRQVYGFGYDDFLRLKPYAGQNTNLSDEAFIPSPETTPAKPT